MNSLNKTIVACIMGTALEWYDFALFGSLAATLASQFFQGISSHYAHILVFVAFASGFIMRPLGALYFGYMGDRHGRKKTLSFTILLMAASTTLIGFVPSYAVLGLMAPLLVILLRLLQGFSASGEYPSAMAWLAEMAPAEQRGFFASFSMAGVCIGVVLGFLMTTIVSASLSAAAFQQWGWRLLFILSAPLGLIGYTLRYRMQESPVFQALQAKQHLCQKPVRTVCQQHAWRLIRVCCFFTFSTVTFYIVYVYLTAYLVNEGFMSLSHVALINAGSIMLMAVLIPYFGALSDRVPRERIMRAGILLSLLLAYPLMWTAIHGYTFSFTITLFIYAMAIAMATGPGSAFSAEQFPSSVRSSGLALVLNLPSSLLGGTAPLIAGFLVTFFHSPVAPVFYFIFSTVLGLLAVTRFSWVALNAEQELTTVNDSILK